MDEMSKNQVVVELRGRGKMGMRIFVPRTVVALRSWRKGELVCMHTVLTLVSCLTTRVLPTEEARQSTKLSLRGLLICLAHYYPPWFRHLTDQDLHRGLDRFFEHQRHQPLSAPVAADLFRGWAIPDLLGVRGRPHTEAELLAAYDPSGVDKTRWAHPVWTLLHMVPASAPFRGDICPTSECKYFQAFLVALADLIPCPQCRSHKWEYCSSKPVSVPGAEALAFRSYLAAWVWEFHNDVTVRLQGPAAAVPLNEALEFWDAQGPSWWGEEVQLQFG